MSPLARSLLALAALLAAADAKSNPFCDGLTRGKQTDFYKSFVIIAKGDEVTSIPDRVTLPGMQLVGDSLGVCNTPYSQPKLITPLGVRYPLRAVYISCPKTVPGCSNLELHVTQYGEMLVSPSPVY